ncbi:MarR family winged helix-turn-helix transcriptional regulator [Sandaracinus amylolyticus]|uniref:Transcriptional regulator, MarR family protein n=1 Tax=Sandaracinus amylolyticus TaxID=927083 RepID=A0A0F6W8U5_9BACT|nr:helix-turn-helix domain-containing protein [Sandaracinus amylolyticus]AKF10283.1 Transcriptional regulator, MarR family protein [Sandaracinus amylolyticus]
MVRRPFDPDCGDERASPAQLLARCARRIDELALERIAARTRIAIRPAHAALFRHLDLEGTRQTELARRAGVSKQAIHQLVSELEELGLVERAPDPEDARATRVRFTSKKGRSLLDELGEVERELEQAIGKERMRALHDALARIDVHLDRAEDARAAPRARARRAD